MQHSIEPTQGGRVQRARPALRAFFVFAVGWACFSSASPAQATPEYPFVLDAALETSCPRPLSRCLICHTTARGGQRTAVQPFADALRDYGLTRGGDGAALQSALLALPDETDSDEDGVADKDELVACGNPSGEELGIGPEYGCDGAHLARVARSEAPLVLVALGVAGLVMRRRRVEGAGASRRDPPHR
jgi:hypothetical protein